MKKIIYFILAAVLSLSLIACNTTPSETTDDTDEIDSGTSTEASRRSAPTPSATVTI